MKWTDMHPGFCEGVMSGPPEPVNAFTSFFLIFYGLMGLFMARNHNMLIRVTSALMAVAGVGSFAYHWTWYAGWGQVDSLPMLIAAYTGAYQAFDTIIFKMIALDTNARRKYELVSGALGFFLMNMLVTSLALAITEDTAQYFSLLFAIPEILLAVAILLIRCIHISS